jgi:glucuronate isomerase
MILDPNRLFPVDSAAGPVAARLYKTVRDLPIISPHGHTDPRWFAQNEAFSDPAALLIQPDHYIFRMLYSQGISLESLGIPHLDGSAAPVDPKQVWRIFAKNYYLFRGTPTRLWLDYSFENQFGLSRRLSPDNADEYYEIISKKLQTPEFRPRALYEQFNIEVLSTTDTPLDALEYHKAIKESGWKGRILPTFRPDNVIDADQAGFLTNIRKLGEITGEDTNTWKGYLNALRNRRAFFKSMGATATDHGHPTASTADLDTDTAASLYGRIVSGSSVPQEREYFRAQMLTEMAGMSVEDGLTMQLHPGSVRNHNRQLYEKFGRDMGADIPSQTEYVRALQPLLKLGPPWWFHDSVEGMMRFREQATETAGFYNTVGFNDDTRALLSIPSRHDVARRVDCAFLGRLVAEHRLDEDEAFEVIQDLTVNLVRKAYKL